jgi:hypothetical protein
MIAITMNMSNEEDVGVKKKRLCTSPDLDKATHAS